MMDVFEEEVKLVRAYFEYNEVERQAQRIFLELSFSRYRDFHFYRNLELYWHTKTMVALGMCPKD